MALYDNVDSSIKKRKQKLNNSHIRNLKIMNILNALVMALLILIDIFLLIKGIFTGMPVAVTVLLILFVVCQVISLTIFAVKRFSRASMVTKVGIVIICFLPIIPYFMYLSIGNNVYIACVLARIICLAALAMLLFNTKTTNDRRTFGVKGVPLAIASGFALLTILYIVASTTNRKIIYQYDNLYGGYVVNDVLSGKGNVVIKNDTVAISGNSLKNVSGNLVIPKNVKYISSDAFVNSKVTSLTIYSSNIELMDAVNNSNIDFIYLEADETKLDVENLTREIDIITDRKVVDKYRETYRKYDYLFVPEVSGNEYYVCYNGTTLPVYIYTKEMNLTEPEKSSLPAYVGGRSILYDGYYISNEEISFPHKVDSNTKISCRYSYIYNVTYDFNGAEETGNLPNMYYDKLGTIYLPELEKDGYRFGGWYNVDQYGNYTERFFELDESLDKDVKLKAKFLKEFKVSYDKILSDAELDVDSETTYTEEDAIELPVPSRDGFTFLGWYLDKNYQVEATTYLNSNTTLYAKWEINNEIDLPRNLSITFDNTAHELDVIATTLLNDVDISYKWYDSNNNLIIEDNTFSVINAADSGDYYAVVTLNYNDLVINEIKTKNINVDIKKKTYDMSSVQIEDIEYVYDGIAHVPSISGQLPIGIDDIQITAKFEEGVTYVGSKSVVCNFTTLSDNYEIPQSMSAVVTITQREVSIIWDNTLTFEYDGDMKFPKYSLYNVLDADKPYVKGVSSGSANAVGEHTATITSLASEGTSAIYKNYKLTSKTENLSRIYTIVSKVNIIDGITVTGTEAIYDGKIHLPNVEIVQSGIRPIYSETPVNVGTYNITVTFEYINTNNENIGNIYKVEVKILPREIELSWEFDEVEYDGNIHNPNYEIIHKVNEDDDISLSYSVVNSINAGTYRIEYLEVLGKDKNNYRLPDNIYYEYKITPKTKDINLDSLEFESKSYDYNGKNQYPTVKNLENGIIVEYSGYGKDAGSYEVKASFSINSNNYVIADYCQSKTITVTINPIAAAISWGQSTFVYDGSDHCPTATVSNLLGSDQCEVTVIGQQLAIGEYTATATALSNSNYYLSEGTTKQFSIIQKDYDFSFEFKDIVVEYDGNSHQPEVVIIGDEPAGLTITYTTEDDNLVDVGIKTVTATFESDGTYNVPNPVSATVTILAREVQLNFVFSNNNTTYSGDAIYPRAVVSNLCQGDTSPLVELDSGENNINAGEYTVRAIEIVGNNNYKISSPIEFTYVIQKATYDASNLRFTNETFTYDGYAHRPTITGLETLTADKGIYVTVSYSEGLKEVGSKSVTATFVGSPNYNTIPSMTATVKIVQREVELSWDGDSFTYTGEVQKPKCILSGLVLNDTCDFTLVAQGINVGTYTASVTNLTNPNYKLPDNSTFTYEITKATISLGSLTFDTASQEYNKTVLYPKMIGSLPDGVEIEYEGLSSDAGTHTITINFIVGSNYNDIPSVNVNVTITKRKISIEWTSLVAVYTGQSSYPSYKLKGIISGDECSITVSGDGVDVGEYTITVTGITNNNYDLDEADRTTKYTIIPADYDMSGITFENKEYVYDGETHLPSLIGTLPNGVTVSFSEGAKNVSDGLVTVDATFSTSDVNYNTPNSMSATVRIVAKELTINWSNLEYTYDHQSHKPTATASGLIGNDTCELTINGYGINAGEYECRVNSVGNANYYANSTATLIIKKAQYDMSSITFADATYTYDGSEHQQTISGLSSIVGLDGISPEVDTYTGSVKNVSDGNKTCVVTFKTSSTNYENPSSMSCTISVTPIVLDLTISLDTDSSTTASLHSWNNEYYLNIYYDGLNHTVNIKPSDSTMVIGNDNPQFRINGTFKDYTGTVRTFTIESDNSNYVSAYTNLSVNVLQLSPGYWWNGTTANWWSLNGASVDDLVAAGDIVLIYTNTLIDGIVFEGTYPTVFGTYTLRYESRGDNVNISNPQTSQSTITVNIKNETIVEFEDTTPSNHTAKTSAEFCEVTGNMKVGVATKEYYGYTFDTALKMEQNTNITLDLSDTEYTTIVLVLSLANGYIKLNGRTYQADSNGILKLGLNSVTDITITKSSTLNLYGIILV